DPDAAAAAFDEIVDSGAEPFGGADAGKGRGGEATPAPGSAGPRRDPVLHDMPEDPLPPRKPSPWD
ncbi:MAG: cell surface protein, partial [Kiritimatiellae bacterium]|nr:cell surface protein [Kiritimatiellia bacterium]